MIEYFASFTSTEWYLLAVMIMIGTIFVGFVIKQPVDTFSKWGASLGIFVLVAGVMITKHPVDKIKDDCSRVTSFLLENGQTVPAKSDLRYCNGHYYGSANP